MDPQVTGALIGAVATAVGAVGATAFAFYTGRLQRRETKEDRAEALVSKYREPLLKAAFELQQRLYSILQRRFLEIYYCRDGTRRFAETSTLWVLGQFFGWMEIMRREVQFLDLGDVGKNQTLERLLLEIRRVVASGSFRPPTSDKHPVRVDSELPEDRFLIFRSDQRAIGELMIVERLESNDQRRSDCMGYAEFVSRLESDEKFASWFHRLRRSIAETAADGEPSRRLESLQHALIDLIEFLDVDRSRFELDERGKALTAVPSADSVVELMKDRDPRPQFRHARFSLSGNLWPVIDKWARCLSYSLAEDSVHDDAGTRRYEKRSAGGIRSVVAVTRRDEWTEICACLRWSIWAQPLFLSLDSDGWLFARSRRSARKDVSLLLEVFGRPKIRTRT